MLIHLDLVSHVVSDSHVLQQQDPNPNELRKIVAKERENTI